MAIDWRKVDPTELEPGFRKDVEALLAKSPHNWTVLSGYRPKAQQAALYQRYLTGGPRAAPPGKSAHNFRMAIDVVPDLDPLRPGLQPDWVTTSLRWAWLKANTVPHPRLKSGWSFGDPGHIERYKWQRYK